MDPKEFQDISRQIISSNGDQGKITALLTQLQDGFSSLFATHTEMSKENTALTDENKQLKEYNLDLFMRVGQKAPKGEETDEQSEKKSRAETITTADLFKKEEK